MRFAPFVLHPVQIERIKVIVLMVMVLVLLMVVLVAVVVGVLGGIAMRRRRRRRLMTSTRRRLMLCHPMLRCEKLLLLLLLRRAFCCRRRRRRKTGRRSRNCVRPIDDVVFAARQPHTIGVLACLRMLLVLLQQIVIRRPAIGAQLVAMILLRMLLRLIRRLMLMMVLQRLATPSVVIAILSPVAVIAAHRSILTGVGRQFGIMLEEIPRQCLAAELIVGLAMPRRLAATVATAANFVGIRFAYVVVNAAQKRSALLQFEQILRIGLVQR